MDVEKSLAGRLEVLPMNPHCQSSIHSSIQSNLRPVLKFIYLEFFHPTPTGSRLTIDLEQEHIPGLDAAVNRVVNKALTSLLISFLNRIDRELRDQAPVPSGGEDSNGQTKLRAVTPDRGIARL